MKKICLLAMLAISAHVAVAEKADSLKETILLSDSIDIDEVTKTRILTGNVSFTRGTMVMAAAKATVREDVDGNQFVVLTSAPGGAVKFRQKRDGGPDLWVEGEAQRIEYDSQQELVKLSSKAKIKQLEGGKIASKLDGEFIAYDSRKENITARNDASGESKLGKERPMIIIAPRLPKPANTAGKQ